MWEMCVGVAVYVQVCVDISVGINVCGYRCLLVFVSFIVCGINVCGVREWL